MENYLPEDDVQAEARARGVRSDAAPLSAASGAALRFLAAAIGARSVVEVGTGCGSSGLWILRGMRPEGILTTVDSALEYQELARKAFLEAGFPSNRARLIHGLGSEVLPRLTDSAYDMVFVDADRAAYPSYLPEALRILRMGGVVVINGAQGVSHRADGPLVAPDPGTAGIREVARVIRDDENLVPLLLPVGDGLLAAIKR
ncbi:O-methyltransferase [Spiractinospora alimapuensis]|uniref:O-methyltransferase n=1 Tax=Spiractinospora alimapuensis TaxID=2820884 RepID=UPI001F327FD7|nr:class I SAM-dependent methyltransferase [Spiractinospora alimapuensis]